MIGEVGRLVPADAAALSRYETDDTVTIIGSWSRTGGYVPVGTRHPLGQGTLGRLISKTRRPGRIDSYAEASGSLAGVVRDDMGWRSAVGAPIVVEGQLWGVVGIGSTTDRPLPLDSEERLVEFTQLVATAISNSQAREELTRLVDEQAALRRVATLVAQGAPPAEVFEAVIVEVGRLVGADAAALGRFEPDGTVTKINEPGAPLSVPELNAVADAVLAAAESADWVVVCGRLSRTPVSARRPARRPSRL